MHLMRRSKVTAGADGLCCRSPQGAHISGIARATKAELVCARIAAEEPVRDALQQACAFDLEPRHLSLPASG
jgi:hypothetical protein